MNGVDHGRNPGTDATAPPSTVPPLQRVLAVYQLAFRLQALAPLHLQGFLGGTLRGALGWSLRECVCNTLTAPCGSCPEGSRCLYPLLFDPADRPRPWVLEPPLRPLPPLARGDRFGFSLTLFGPATAQLPALVAAVRHLAAVGLGRTQVPCRLEQVLLREGGRSWPIWEGEGRFLAPAHRPQSLALATPAPPAGEQELRLRFETPLNLRVDGRQIDGWHSHHFFQALFRRCELLLALYGEPSVGPLPSVVPSLRQVDEAVTSWRTLNADLEWRVFERFQSGPEKGYVLSGLLGEVRGRGQFGSLLPLLEFGQRVHVGKKTTFGLGYYSFELM